MSDAPIEITSHDKVDASVIWLHGLGADGHDFVPVVEELNLRPDLGIRFIFPHAPFRPITVNGGYVMRGWYDIFSLQETNQEDGEGLEESRHTIDSLINREIQRGVDSRRIILMGFSQGGAVALYAGLRCSQPLAGIGALSTYLPLRSTLAMESHGANQETPVFMAHGVYDPVIPHEWAVRSRRILVEQGYTVTWQEYNMEHGVCQEEIQDISAWLTERLRPGGD